MAAVCPGQSLQKHPLPCASLKKCGGKLPLKAQTNSAHNTLTLEENGFLEVLFRILKAVPVQLSRQLSFRQSLPSLLSELPWRLYKGGGEASEVHLPAVMGDLGAAISSSPAVVAHECFIKYPPWDSS